MKKVEREREKGLNGCKGEEAEEKEKKA